MFEYLMPLLVMPSYEGTLLDQTCRATVERQIAYGKQRGVPWGISECGYNAVDASLNYQYRAFGVPGLGLKRGLAEDLVIAPYASALALTVAPEDACVNLQRLAAEGLAGRFGLYEAVDYTPARAAARTGQRGGAIVHGASPGHGAARLAHVLLGHPMQRRFVSDPLFKATLLLLQERIPKASAALRASRRAVRHPRRFRRTGGVGPHPPQSRHADARGAASLQRALPRHGDPRRRRQQSLEGSRGHALARGRHLRRLGHVLLSARRAERSVLVDGVPADREATGALRSDLQRSARGIPPARRRRRDAHRDRGLAGGRHRAAPAPRHQPRAGATHPRRDELCRGRAVAPRRGRAAPRVRQPVRADGDRPGAAGHPVHPAPALGPRTHAVDVPPHGRARRRGVRGLLRDRSHALRRSRALARRAPRHDRSGGAVGKPGIGPRSHRRDPPADHARAAADGDDRHRHRHRRDARCRAGHARQVPGPAPRGPRVRPRVDARLGHAAADQRHRGGRAALQPSRRVGGLRPRRRSGRRPPC